MNRKLPWNSLIGTENYELIFFELIGKMISFKIKINAKILLLMITEIKS